MKNKDSIQTTNNSTVDLNTYTPNALENTLQSLDLIHSNKKNIDYSQYKDTLIPVLSDSIKHNNIDIEAKKDISYKNKQIIKKSNFNHNIFVSLLCYYSISFIAGLAITIPLFIYTTTGGVLNSNLFIILKSIGTLLTLSSFVSLFLSIPFIFYGTIQKIKFNNNIKNNKKVLSINKSLQEKIISEINQIENPQLTDIKESLKNYIVSEKISLKQKILRKIMLLKIKKNIHSNIVNECSEHINSKLIKEKEEVKFKKNKIFYMITKNEI